MSAKSIDIVFRTVLQEEGEVEAFTLVFNLYRPRLIHLSLNYLNNEEDAQEVVQEVFIKIWKKRKKLTAVRNLNAYLYRATKNGCIDYLRRNRLRDNMRLKGDPGEYWIHYYSLEDEAASSILEQELNKEIELAISSLPDKCQRVFIKNRIDGLKYKEISEEMNISVKTIENHMNKALKHMRLHLREYLPFL